MWPPCLRNPAIARCLFHDELFIISGLSYGVEWEPDELQPYYVFHGVEPKDNIAGATLVYDGTFDLRRVQAVSHIIKANNELPADPAAALRDAQAALALTPTSVRRGWWKRMLSKASAATTRQKNLSPLRFPRRIRREPTGIPHSLPRRAAHMPGNRAPGCPKNY